MIPASGCFLDLGIPPEPESDPVSQLHEREEAEAQAQAHQSANLNFSCWVNRACFQLCCRFNHHQTCLWQEGYWCHPCFPKIKVVKNVTQVQKMLDVLLPDVFEYSWLLLKVEGHYRNVLLVCIIGGIDVICCSEDCRLSLLYRMSWDVNDVIHLKHFTNLPCWW